MKRILSALLFSYVTLFLPGCTLIPNEHVVEQRASCDSN